MGTTGSRQAFGGGLCLCRCSGYPGPPQDLVDDRRQSVREHFTFSHELLELRQGIAVLTEKLEAHLGDSASQQAEVEVRARGLCGSTQNPEGR